MSTSDYAHDFTVHAAGKLLASWAIFESKVRAALLRPGASHGTVVYYDPGAVR